MAVTLAVAVLLITVPAAFRHWNVAPGVVELPVSVTLVWEHVSGPSFVALALGGDVSSVTTVVLVVLHPLGAVTIRV